eukprot:GDKI01020168.1.p1 GENE.GDKI01020168.1~~GDKI01020168.1.p1  ORF type:complete len:296 (+),score=77.44 GDKI01020168.1:110-997(+)
MSGLVEKYAEKDAHGQVFFTLTNPATGSSCIIYQQGATVSSWKDSTGDERLFVSSKCVYKEGVAIRGGVPICWPQFSGFGSFPKHGYVRNSTWELKEVKEGGGSVVGVFVLPNDNKEQMKHLPLVSVEYHVTLDNNDHLITELRVKNNHSHDTVEFTGALHTYYRVGDISQVSVSGLQNMEYVDQIKPVGQQECVELHQDITICSEVDRIYKNVPANVQIIDKSKGRKFTISRSREFPDCVLWNPWVEKAISLPDFADDEYHNMVCLEPAVIATPAKVAPGEMWCGVQKIACEKL